MHPSQLFLALRRACDLALSLGVTTITDMGRVGIGAGHDEKADAASADGLTRRGAERVWSDLGEKPQI